jgi:hypothetical protein
MRATTAFHCSAGRGEHADEAARPLSRRSLLKEWTAQQMRRARAEGREEVWVLAGVEELGGDNEFGVAARRGVEDVGQLVADAGGEGREQEAVGVEDRRVVAGRGEAPAFPVEDAEGERRGWRSGGRRGRWTRTATPW